MRRSIAFLGLGTLLTAGAAVASLDRHEAPGLTWTASGDDRPGPDSARVVAFLDALNRADPLVCDLASSAVGNFYNRTDRGAGVGAFGDDDPRWLVVRDSLAESIQDRGALAVATAALGHQNPCVRRAAAHMIGRSHELGYQVIRDVLGERDARRREAALYAATSLEDPRLFDEITQATADPTPAVAAMAAVALGDLEDRRATRTLIGLLRHDAAVVRRSAASALGDIEDPAAVMPLLALIDDADPGTRLMTVEALGQIEDVRAAGGLARALSDSDRRVRRQAAEALGDLDDLGRAPPALIEALRSDDPDLRRAAAEALGDIEDPSAVPGLGALIGSADLELRRAAVEALADIDDASVTPFLMRALKDSDPKVRLAAAEALGDRK